MHTAWPINHHFSVCWTSATNSYLFYVLVAILFSFAGGGGGASYNAPLDMPLQALLLILLVEGLLHQHGCVHGDTLHIISECSCRFSSRNLV